jgi:preprotein translocase SecE subunit
MARQQRRRGAALPREAAPGERRQRARENLPRPTAAAASTSVARPQPAARRRSPFGFFRRLQPRFVVDIISELRKVTWPTFAETRYLSIVVAIVAVTVGIFLGAIDLFFGWIIERLFF